MVISFRVLYKLRQRSIPCVGRTAVFCGQSRHVEVERGICSVLVVGGVVEVEVEGGRRVSGLSVAGRLEGGKGTCGHGYMSAGFTHICTSAF